MFPRIYPITETAITVSWGNNMEEAHFEQVQRLMQQLESNPFPGYAEAVPAYASLTIYYNPVIVSDAFQLKPGTIFNRVSSYIQSLLQLPMAKTTFHNRPVIEIPVCYGGEFGPDLGFVARQHQLPESEVISIHTSQIYRVYMIGFMPGFPYLGLVPDKIATPRKAVPQPSVPAGSVGIAGQQTGIYPYQSPGGWQIIGQTSIPLFNPDLPKPSLLSAGDQVRFISIGKEQFMDTKLNREWK
jgi:inhibitor of KinA